MNGWNTRFLLGWPIFRGYVSFRGCSLTESFKQKVKAVEKKLHDLMEEPIATRRKLFKDTTIHSIFHTKQIQQIKQDWNEDGTFATLDPCYSWRIIFYLKGIYWRVEWGVINATVSDILLGHLKMGRDGTGATGGVSPWQEFFITCQRGVSARPLDFDLFFFFCWKKLIAQVLGGWV